MSPEEMRKILETVIDKKFEYYWVYIFLSVVFYLIAAFLYQYFKNKGENYATKQDIAIITKKMEEVKAEIQNQQEVMKQKRKLKYDALLQSLTLIDAHLSHHLNGDSSEIKKQFASTEEARKCHNSLILTCETDEVLEKFSRIMLGPKNSKEGENLPPTMLLNDYRNLVRKELGFGKNIFLDEERAWFANMIFDKGRND